MARPTKTGQISRLYANYQGAFIRIKYSGTKPKDDYFFLERDHVNYNSMFSIATVAAVNRYDLIIGVNEDKIDTGTIATVSFVFIDF